MSKDLITKELLTEEYLVNRYSIKKIAEKYGTTDSLIESRLRKYQIKKGRFKDVVSEDKLSTIDPIFCYYAGLVATDGYIDRKNCRVAIRFCNEGAAIVLEKLKEYFEFTGEIRKYRSSYDLTISSEKLINLLDSMDIGGTSYDVGFPKSFESEDCARMFMRGVLDGDGNIHVVKSKYTGKFTGGQFRIVKSSERFIQGIVDFLNSTLDVQCRLSTATVKGVDYPKLEMTVGDSKLFYDWVYCGFSEFKFPEKYSKYCSLAG